MSFFIASLLIPAVFCARPGAAVRPAAGQASQQTSPQEPSPAAEPAAALGPEKAAGEAGAKPAARELPAKVTLAEGTRIEVVLETPLSTRIAKKNQEVVFRATQPIPLADGLELPDQTAFIGIVTEAKRPGAFGRQGALTVALRRIDLPSGVTAPVLARLDSPDMRGKGRLTPDSRRGADLGSLATWTLAGTVIGGESAGGKGAGYGAASGAAIWLISMLAHRGADVYLEPGMPFTVLLDEPVQLPGSAANFSADNSSGQSRSASSSEADMPRLKHRPKP